MTQTEFREKDRFGRLLTGVFDRGEDRNDKSTRSTVTLVNIFPVVTRGRIVKILIETGVKRTVEPS